MMIKNLQPRLAERGKIKIGCKGEMRTSARGNQFQPPQKLDHFVITTATRGPDGNYVRDEVIHAMLGEKPTSIPVRVLFDDPELVMMSRYAAYRGKTMVCSGDGETAQETGQNGVKTARACPCPRLEQTYKGDDRCKINGALSVIIDGVEGVGGVYTFRTTSWNSVTALISSMQFIRALTGGALAGIQLMLTLRPKTVADPNTGASQTVYVVNLEYPGSVAQLRSEGLAVLQDNASHTQQIKMIEAQARATLALPAPDNVPLAGDDADDVVDEFYPQAIAAPPPPRPQRSDYAPTTIDAEELPDFDPAGPSPTAEAAEPVAQPLPTAQPAAAEITIVNPQGEPVSSHARTNVGAREYVEQMAEHAAALRDDPEELGDWLAVNCGTLATIAKTFHAQDFGQTAATLVSMAAQAPVTRR